MNFMLFRKWITGHMTFHSHELGIFLNPIAFLVHLSEFYTHLNAVTIEKFSLNMVFKLDTPVYSFLRK